jgi:dTDP-glucose 4,6-dehydratase/UDP-glucose 4-epimerase
LPREDLDAAIDLADQCFRELRGARIFLTGCTGFFGVWILETLRRADERFGLGLDLTLLSRSPNAFVEQHPHLAPADRLRYLQGDIRSFAFPVGIFSHVIHGATTNARETFAGEDPLRKFDTVALGTRRVLEFCESGSVSDMLYVGSGAVYGRRTTPEPICEDDPFAPHPLDVGMTLGHAKRAAELFCAIYGARCATRIKIARCFSFVGPQLPLDIHYAIGNFIADAIAERPITVTGTGRAVRSYMYMSDLVAWLVTILVRGTPLRPYNVGSEDGRPVLEMANVVARIAGQRVQRPRFPEKEARSSAGDNYVPSAARSMSELGLRQSVPLEESIRKMLAYHALQGLKT